MMYRSRVSEKCGPPAYTTGDRYTNPFNDRDAMGTIQVKYSLVEEYNTASSKRFIFFQGLILFLWFVHLVMELKAVIQLADFVYGFPHDNTLPILTPRMRRRLRSARSTLSRHFSSRSVDEGSSSPHPLDPEDSEDEKEDALDEEGKHVIKKISMSHKFMVTSMLAVRVYLLVFMFHVGSMFLLTNHKYDDLLLNAVALAFIFELPEFLYAFLVSDEMKSDLEDAHTIDYITALPTRGYAMLFFSKALWGIVIIPVVVLIAVLHNYTVTTLPSLRALRCVCFQDGEYCDVASRFSRDWWNAYWKDVARMFEQSSVFSR